VLAGVSIALVVAVILVVVALVQRSDAIANAKTAESRQAAASAEAELSSNPKLSVQLALAGLKVHDTAQATTALRDALPNLQLLRTLQDRRERFRRRSSTLPVPRS
jgi:Tfp pilus assembly protein PilF